MKVSGPENPVFGAKNCSKDEGVGVGGGITFLNSCFELFHFPLPECHPPSAGALYDRKKQIWQIHVDLANPRGFLVSVCSGCPIHHSKQNFARNPNNSINL